MNKRFLNKKIDSSLLKQFLPENVLHKSRSRKQVRKTKFVTNYNLNGSERTWQWSTPKLSLTTRLQASIPNALASSKLDRIRQAETQIVREFVQKELNLSGYSQGAQKAPSLSELRFPTGCEATLALFAKSDVKVTTFEDKHKKSANLPCSSLSRTLSSSVLSLQSQEKEFELHRHASPSTSRKQSYALLRKPILKDLTEENVFLLLSIEQIRSVLVSKRIGAANQKQTSSELRDQLLESRKIRFLYGGLSKRELEQSIKRAKQFLGSTADNLLIVLESRLDVALERCCFFSSIGLARQSIVHKRVRVNEKIVNTPGYWLQPGDVIQVQFSKKCFANIETSKRNISCAVDSSFAQVPRPCDHLVSLGIKSRVKSHSITPAKPAKGVQRSQFAFDLPQSHGMCGTLAELAPRSAVWFTHGLCSAHHLWWLQHTNQSQARLFHAKRPASLDGRSEVIFPKKINNCLNKTAKGFFTMAYALRVTVVARATRVHSKALLCASHRSSESNSCHMHHTQKVTAQTHNTKSMPSRCYKQLLILKSLFQLECLIFNICLQAARARPLKGIGAQLDLRCLSKNRKALLRMNILIEASELCFAIQNKAHFSDLFLEKRVLPQNAQAKLRFASRANAVKQSKGSPEGIFGERSSGQATKEFILKPSLLKKNNSWNTSLYPILDSIFKAATPHLALHVLQLLQKKKPISTAMPKQDMYTNKDINQQDCLAPFLLSQKEIPNFVAISNPKLRTKEQSSCAYLQAKDDKKLSKHNDIVLLSFFHDTLYHVYFYWLQLTKRVFLQNAGERLFRQDLLFAKNRIIPFQFRRIKPLHMEVSYQSCTAVFLYPPQRVHLPALVNIDLLVKVL